MEARFSNISTSSRIPPCCDGPQIRASLQDNGAARNPSTDLPQAGSTEFVFRSGEYIPNYSVEQAAPTVGVGTYGWEPVVPE